MELKSKNGFDKVNEIFEQISKQKKELTVKVGVLGGNYDDGTPIANVAFWLEYGTKRIAPKYFLSRSLFDNLEDIAKLNVKLQRGINQGRFSQDQAIRILGEQLQKYAKQQITKQGLIDSETMRSHIVYGVE